MRKSIKNSLELEAVLDYYGPNGEHWEHGGWGQEQEDTRCVLNAISHVAGLEVKGLQAEKVVGKKKPWIIGALNRAIDKLFPGRVNPHVPKYKRVFLFNDDEQTTWEDMQMVLKEASFNLRYGDDL